LLRLEPLPAHHLSSMIQTPILTQDLDPFLGGRSHVVVQFSAEGQQPGAVVGTGNDPIAAELAAEDLDLGFQKPDAGVAASGTGFKQEMREDVEPAKHGN
ncbi:MAG: hypothetical protein DCC66_11415, partial [Planctomycetota bacterium]